jgi:oligopeptide/dipeptide ABC transporter ATP-binding protein
VGTPGTPAVAVRDLHLAYQSGGTTVHAVQGASLVVGDGEAVGLVGESGSGKSSLARALIGLLPRPQAAITGGQILVGDRNVTHLSPEDWPALRGHAVAMVFQDALSFLNPVMRIDRQIAEAVTHHDRSAEVPRRVAELIERVHLPLGVRHAYPFQLSGGMRQRVVLAIALGCRPRLLVADEPTTALDATTQVEILKLLADIQAVEGMALLLISHDLAVIRALCRRVYVMYAGRTVEWGPTEAVFGTPAHPYVEGLLAAALNVRDGTGRFATVEGEVPDLRHLAPGCPFTGRCTRALAACADHMPPAVQVGRDPGGTGGNGVAGHEVRCWLHASPA